MSDLFNLIISDDESVMSSSMCVDSADQNQKQSHNDLTNHSTTIEISENDNLSIEGSENVA